MWLARRIILRVSSKTWSPTLMLSLKWAGIVAEQPDRRVWWDLRGHPKVLEFTRELPHLKESSKETKINKIKSLTAHTNFLQCAPASKWTSTSSRITRTSVNSHSMRSKATQRAFFTSLRINIRERHHNRVEVAGISRNLMDIWRASIQAIQCLRRQ